MKYQSIIKIQLILAFIFLSFISCEQEKILPASSTQVDFSTYVAVGNSLTAGYMNGALYDAGQKASYPELLAKEFQKFGGAKGFRTPLVGNEDGQLTLGGAVIPDFENRFINLGVRKNGPGSAVTTTIYNANNPFYNYGIPGVRSFHFLSNSYGNVSGLSTKPATANPYFVKLASNSTSGILDDISKLKHTFFSLWVGNNDVLSNATSGGVSEDKNDPFNKTANAITSTSTFSLALSTIVASLTREGAKGVIANIPNITDIPYFTTVPAKPIRVSSTAQAAGLNSLYTTYNNDLQSAVSTGTITQSEADARNINFIVGANFPVIDDSELKEIGGKKIRQLKEGELILLTANTELTAGKGSSTGLGLSDRVVLTKNENLKISTAIASYNAIIKNLANQYDLAFFDANALMNKLKSSGIVYGSTNIQATIGSGFSLDGVHPGSRGYAIIADGFIDAINNKFNKTITKTNPATVFEN